MTRVQRVKGPEQSERAIRNEGGFGDHSVGRPLRPAKSVWQCAYADLPAARADCQRLPGQWHRCDHFQVARRVMLQSRRGARGPGRTRLSQSLGRGPGRRATVLVCAGESTWLSPACDPPVELAKRANAKDGGSSVQMPCFDAPRIHGSTNPPERARPQAFSGLGGWRGRPPSRSPAAVGRLLVWRPPAGGARRSARQCRDAWRETPAARRPPGPAAARRRQAAPPAAGRPGPAAARRRGRRPAPGHGRRRVGERSGLAGDPREVAASQHQRDHQAATEPADEPSQRIAAAGRIEAGEVVVHGP